MFYLPFSREARRRKAQRVALNAARVYVLSFEDVMDVSEIDAAWRAKDAEKCEELLEKCEEPKSFAAGREWLDILVVSISVAMAFRAYFYEPFNIPTGSMQPTLYGNHTAAAKPSDKSVWDLPGLSFVKYLATGEVYKEFRAPWSGQLTVGQRNDGCFDLFVYNPMHAGGGFLYNPKVRWLAGIFMENELENMNGLAKIPTDAIRGSAGDAPEANGRQQYRLNTGFAIGDRVKKGDLIWCGKVKTGDFLFVNRWLWNFRHPRRGDVMIFSTTGIKPLAQGTHYIKRMTGLPGETIEIHKPDVFINGEKIAPLKPAQGADGERMPQPNAAAMPGAVKLGTAEYFACGDNSDNSYDSRYWGPVPAKNLCGIAGGVFWPFFNSRWGVVK